MSILNETFVLKNGIQIPKIGFGTWQVPDGEIAYQAVKEAIESGYVHIDTAYVYQNEVSVGKAIKDSKVDRSSLFITSKLPSEIKTYHETFKYFEETLKRVDLDYLDLYLIHAPWPWSAIGKDCKEGNAEAWKAIHEIYETGKIKAIGVSNFSIADLKDLYERTHIVPHVNQIPLFIGLYPKQKALIEYCESKGILVEAYSPLAIGYALTNDIIVEMANQYKKTPAQICIRYCLEKGTLPLPKTTKQARMIENASVDFKMKEADILALDQLDVDPRRF
jgi:diketogulonate reductase-like aldo/keto reductase